MDLPNKVDKNPIQHQIDFVRFDFYDPETVKRISIKPLTDPVAFDNFGNPNRGGLHDQEMGVGAYDKIGSCQTCKQGTNECTGHFGHIELSAVLYNPFMLNYILKLMRNKCFFCHRLRLTKKDKIYIFMKILLVKLGLTKEAAVLQSVMYTTALESTKPIENKVAIFLTNFSDLIGELIQEEEDTLAGSEEDRRERYPSIDTTNTDDTNNTHENNNIPGGKKTKKKKQQLSEEDLQREAERKRDQENFKNGIKDKKSQILDEILEKVEKINESIKSNPEKYQIIFNQTLNENILLRNTISEFWKMAKSGKCPHCDAMNAKIKKVGNIKFFQAPFSKNLIKKMKRSGINPNKDALEEGSAHQEEIKSEKKKEKRKKKEEMEDNVIIETTEKGKKKKKAEDVKEEFGDDESESEVDEADAEESHKYLHPMEIQEHIKRLWEVDGDLLSLIFGNLMPKGEEEVKENIEGNQNHQSEYKFKIATTGYHIFFLESLIVPPNRFRPENKSGGDGVYLHAQTAAYTKLLNLSNELRNLSLAHKKEEEKNNSEMRVDHEEVKDNKNPNDPAHKESRPVTMKDLIVKWSEMQDTVNILFDSTKAANKRDGDKAKGIKQLLEKKQGVYRTKMMGKRVNYAGRSVISPDPMISASEVGIPLYIAQKLVFTEVVTSFNKEKLQQLVRNGNKKYPGASMVVNLEGRTISLDIIKEDFRLKLAENLREGEKVVRHMQTGDALLVNRQPTLHKSSIMSHKARVLPGEKTIRLHYANCNTYNADFDGDEMNIHLMQNHIARQEAYTISNTDNQYITPTNGKPLRGLIQDSIVSSVFLTMKNSFFTREEYHQLVYSCLEAPLNNGTIKGIVIQTPTIVKPKMLYTGKQVVTTVLKSLFHSKLVDKYTTDRTVGLNFEHGTKLKEDIWGSENLLEGRVVVRDNELLTGVLDKNHIGNSEFGIVHAFYEMYGPEIAGELISTFGRLFISYLQFFHGFTCGVEDIILKDEFNLKRRKDIENIMMSGMTGLANFLEMDNFRLTLNNYSRRNIFTRKTPESIAHLKLIPKEREEIEQLMKIQNVNVKNIFNEEEGANFYNEENEDIESSNKLIKDLKEKYYEIVLKDESNKIEANLDTIVKNAIHDMSSSCTSNWLKGLGKNFPENYFSMMVLSGAKGSLVNHSQITCMLGQQELEGRRVPRMASGRTLPSFEPFDPNPRAGGFVADRFSTGIRPQEFFFHCMAGREGLIDTAVKTSRSGYLQRCLIKHLEQVIVNYDYTVRDIDGNIIQFLYGEDSLDALHTKYLTNFPFIANNINAYHDKYNNEKLQEVIDLRTVQKARRNMKKEGELETDTLLNNYQPWRYLGSISERVHQRMMEFIAHDRGEIFEDKKNEKIDEEEMEYRKKADDARKKNAEAEREEDNKSAKKHSKNQPGDALAQMKKNKISKLFFKSAVFLKYLYSLIQPGESVGILAAQSIGEPSTQMTLNTFHLAGHGGANMTLGVPRLREILMTSEKNIKTPIMELPLLTNNPEVAKKLARNFDKYFLIDIIKHINIKQNLIINRNSKFRKYYISMNAENLRNISAYFEYGYETLIKKFKLEFIPRFAKYIEKCIKLSAKKGEIVSNQVKIRKGKTAGDDDGNEEKAEDYEAKRGDDVESEDDNDEQEYEDVEGAKKRKKENTEETYTDEEKTVNEDEDETNNLTDELNDGSVHYQEENYSVATDENLEKIIKEDEEAEDEAHIEGENEEDKKKKKKEKLRKDMEILNSKVFSSGDVKIENMDLIEDFENDSTNFSFEMIIPFNQKNVLLKNLLDHTMKSITFKSVKNVHKCHLKDKGEKSNPRFVLTLEGINFDEVVRHSGQIDVNKVYTNDIGNILHKYGIEACRAAIVKEIFEVFNSYHIAVDKRHLGLIADYMTHQGDYRSFNRKGLSVSSSPFLKMTFESTMEHIIHSCISKEVDNGKSASSKIILGQVPQCGTGMFTLLQNIVKNK